MTACFTTARSYAGQPYTLPSSLTEQEHAVLIRKIENDDLICPIEECDSPQLVWVPANNNEPMCFAHRKEPGSPHTEKELRNSIWRLQAKATLADWCVKTQKARVSKERFRSSKERKPALTVAMAGGGRLAVEFLLDSGGREDTHEGWLHLNKQHNDAGTPVLWIIPHYGTEGLDSYHEETFPLTRMHRLLLENDVPLFWFNPVDSIVYTAVVLRKKEGTEYSVPPTRSSVSVTVKECSLQECFLAPTGLQHPALMEAKENLHPHAAVTTDVSRLRNQIRAKALAAGATNLPDCYPNIGFHVNPLYVTSWEELREKAEENGYADVSEILYVRNLYEDDVDERIARALKRND